MNRKFYYYGIFFIGLYAIITFLQSLIYIQLNTRTYLLDTFLSWFILMNLVSNLGWITLLKYYHYKKYYFTFFLGAIHTSASLLHSIVVYRILVARELEFFFTYSYPLTLGTSALYAISLMFSNARKRFYLKIAGVFKFIIGLFLISIFIWSSSFQDVKMKEALGKVFQLCLMADSLLLVLFILNFLNEIKISRIKSINTTLEKFLDNLIGLLGFVALISTFFLGIKMTIEVDSELSWFNNRFDRVEKFAQPFEARIYVGNENDTLNYRLLTPLDYDPKRKYPLVVCLHHGGGWGKDNLMQIDASEPARVLSKQFNREKYPAFVLVPQCPKGTSFGGLVGYPAIDSLVFETIGLLEQEFSIDVKRRYVIGMSLGGYGTWHFISTRPKMFAAAIPICGGGDPTLADKIVDVKIWAFHGEKDRNVPVKLSRDMIKAIRVKGGNPLYTEFPDSGHRIWNQVNRTSNMWDWLFIQKRD
ncbi:dienelactone hydrolase family protein [uncultured Aquimarina sp.]|uniref:carboxylesterase family protein n=1 Tax=uncultured Aquimarina sp. TaxID=575652 RepID=UPI00261AC5E1|nr:dienelactone hydrolase family protein [uncultured Aquimarina sp.]